MSKKVILFYADWCGHCKTFKPIWEKLKGELKNNNNIEFEEYESDNKEIMNKFNINGYPTIKVIENNISSDYNGMRDMDSILTFLNIQSNKHNQLGGNIDSIQLPNEIQIIDTQTGGKKNKDYEMYYSKYNKYKKKYLELKKK